MKIVVIGSGAREHAAAHAFAASPKVTRVFVIPGRAGMDSDKITSVRISEMNDPRSYFQCLAEYAHEVDAAFTFVGPDEMLANGIVDEYALLGLRDRIFGPTAAAARIESSKAFAKQIMESAGIRTAASRTFTDYATAVEYVRSLPLVPVIKASGLAGGKGVIVPASVDEALEALRRIMVDRVFGDAGNEVVVEEFLSGIEFSIHAIVDRTGSFRLFPAMQDHKRIGASDTGKNTGGMGVVGPLPWMTPSMMDRIGSEIIRPLIDAMNGFGCPFCGMLYPSIMLGPDGSLSVIEFNARPGDPEMQVLSQLYRGDFASLIDFATRGRLDEFGELPEYTEFCACLTLSSQGYPDQFETGFPITGIEAARRLSGVEVFHAGTRLVENGFVTDGGRVLSVTALGPTLKNAVDRAYLAASRIGFAGKYVRPDIGTKALHLSDVLC